MANNYILQINDALRPKISSNLPVVVDLFAGCGGLSLGFEAQGFLTKGYEMDEDCCNTYNGNITGGCTKAFLTVETEYPKAEIVIGGPPCQPFSIRGKQKGIADERNGFPAYIAAIEKIHPDLWLFENVRGLLARNSKYLQEVLDSLDGLGYDIEVQLVNAVNHNVPQNRERIIAVGTKKGMKKKFKFPEKTEQKITAGEALGELARAIPENPKYLTASMDAYIARYEAASKCAVPRDLHMDRPARTLTCRNVSAATSDMHRIKMPDGRRRMLEVREAARLQSFPDWFDFYGTETSAFVQIGNAVPPMLSFCIAGAIREYIESL